jgi:tRNA G18 (ribose-2'-O)-methylase SpoU
MCGRNATSQVDRVSVHQERPMFTTVLHNLNSPFNVGTIIRSHVAFGGDDVIFVGLDKPWRFKKNTQAFSRRLEKLCNITYLSDDDALFTWCSERGYSPIAIEISSTACLLAEFHFPEKTALIVGHEGRGLSDAFLARCEGTAIIPQFGDVPCLNVGISAAIAMYEFRRNAPGMRTITGNKFSVPIERRVEAP